MFELHIIFIVSMYRNSIMHLNKEKTKIYNKSKNTSRFTNLSHFNNDNRTLSYYHLNFHFNNLTKADIVLMPQHSTSVEHYADNALE